MNHEQMLESAIRSLMAMRPRVLVAIDGMAASGKTTLAGAVAQRIPGCAVVHMDDFTVPFEDRYPGYFDKTLSNADIARFDREVLSPLARGSSASYRPYRCHPVPGFGKAIQIPESCPVVIVEGAYCLHDDLWDRYDLHALMTIAPDTQRIRILARNGAAQLERFLSAWIPMELAHISARRLHERCELIFSEEKAT